MGWSARHALCSLVAGRSVNASDEHRTSTDRPISCCQGSADNNPPRFLPRGSGKASSVASIRDFRFDIRGCLLRERRGDSREHFAEIVAAILGIGRDKLPKIDHFLPECGQFLRVSRELFRVAPF